jgi:hypothetical protein
MSIPQLLSALTNGQQITLADGRVVTVSKSGGKAIATVIGYPPPVPPAPGFTFTPSSVLLGGSVALTATGGANFTGATSATIGGAAQPSYTVNSTSSLTINNIGGSGGVIQVTAPAGTYTSSTSLAIITEPAAGDDALVRLRSSDLVLSGSDVTAMTNSGFGGQTVTSPSGSRPTRIVSGQNGRQVIDCDQTDYFNFGSNLVMGANFTVMIACNTRFPTYYLGHNSPEWQMVALTTGIRIYNGATEVTSPQPLTTPFGTWSVLTWRQSGGVSEFFENSTSLGTISVAATPTFSRLGRIGPSATLFNCQLGDVYIWDTALSVSVRTAMVGYLMAKWAIA